MSVSSASESRVEVSPRTAVLAAGDVLAILVFVGVGEYTHGYNPFVDVGRVAGTMIPFLVGWTLIAVVSGLYAGDATLTRTVIHTFGAWVGAVVVAQALRATDYFHGDAALTFALVSVAIGGALLCGWRVASAFVR